VGNYRQCAVWESVVGCFVLLVSSMRLILVLLTWCPILLYPTPILRSPWRFVGFVPSKMTYGVISQFCLAPYLSGASFALNALVYAFVIFSWSLILKDSFLPKCYHLRFRDFYLAPNFVGPHSFGMLSRFLLSP
jgi:hypothetical protein